MADINPADQLLHAWLRLSSTLWNTRIVQSLTYNETHVMGILLRHTDTDPLTATDLIQRTRLLKSQMNKLLTSLEDRGFITRVRSAMDKRLIHIQLTELGRRAYLNEHKGVESFLEELIGKMGEERAVSLARDLCDVSCILDEIVPACK